MEAERRAIAEVMSGKPSREAPAWKEVLPELKILAHYFDDFLSKYAGEHKPSERRAKKRIWTNHLRDHFGQLTLATITQDHVDSFAVEQRTRLTRKTVSNRLAILSSLIKYVAERERVAKPKLRLTLGKTVGEVEAVAMSDVDKLVEAADPLFRVAVLLAAEAGLRAGELRGLQWTDVRDGMIKVRRALDSETNEVTLPKHDRLRDVPVSERLDNALKALTKRGIWVLSHAEGRALRYDEIYEPMLELYESAGATRPSSPVHCLRHSYGTELAARGVPLPVIQRLMGHSDVRTTMQYITVGEAQLRDAVSSVFGASRGSHAAAKRKRRRD
jgi:integrase